MTDNDPRLKKVQQMGLHAKDWSVVDNLSRQVDAFNRSKGAILVELEITELTPEEVEKNTKLVGQPYGKYLVDFTFENRYVQKAFWFGQW